MREWDSKVWIGLLLILLGILLLGRSAHSAPDAALPYQRDLAREARALWGLDAPTAVMAAQIDQESAWNPLAQSAYAAGLAQFTPSTATWISGAYRRDLGENQPFNPAWALRALVRYDYDLYAGIAGAKEACSRWAFALSGYNGGPGWVTRDRALCSAVSGCDPNIWFGNTELYTQRSEMSAKENRGYPRRILLLLQAAYETWGGRVPCSLKPS